MKSRTLPKIIVSLFRKPPVGIKSRQNEQLAALKSDCGSFFEAVHVLSNTIWRRRSFLLPRKPGSPVGSVNRRENADWNKIIYIRCLESDLLEHNAVPFADTVIIDGAAIVQMIYPRPARPFKEYGEREFAPNIYAELVKSSPVYLV